MDVQPEEFIGLAPLSCKPDYAALVAIQTRLAGDSNPSDQLLLSVGMTVDVEKLATELLICSVDAPTSCNVTGALSEDLRQVEYVLDKLDTSVTGATERWVTSCSNCPSKTHFGTE